MSVEVERLNRRIREVNERSDRNLGKKEAHARKANSLTTEISNLRSKIAPMERDLATANAERERYGSAYDEDQDFLNRLRKERDAAQAAARAANAQLEPPAVDAPQITYKPKALGSSSVIAVHVTEAPPVIEGFQYEGIVIGPDGQQKDRDLAYGDVEMGNWFVDTWFTFDPGDTVRFRAQGCTVTPGSWQRKYGPWSEFVEMVIPMPED